jgi:hypothetical protein
VSSHTPRIPNPNLKNNSYPEEVASIISSSQPNASLWLTAIPIDPSYRLSDYEMIAAIRMRLHLPPVDLHTVRTIICPCGRTTKNNDDEYNIGETPLHYQSCPSIEKEAAGQRHDLVLQTLNAIAKEIQIPTHVEQRSYDQTDRKKPDLRLTLAQHNLSSLVTDVAITHPATATKARINGSISTAVTPLYAAKVTEGVKTNKYIKENNQHHHQQFIPFVLESYGAWGTKANKVLQLIMKNASDDERADRTIDAKIRISIALQRGNAIMHKAGVQLLDSDYDTKKSHMVRMNRLYH